MGLDLGINFLAVASTNNKKILSFLPVNNKNKRNVYKDEIKITVKGTLSAKWMIKHLAGKEKRLMKDFNHCISKAVVKFAVENGVYVIGIENST